MGGITVHMSIDQADGVANVLLDAGDQATNARAAARFTDRHAIAVAAISPGDWVLADDGDDWQQVAAKVRGPKESDFTFHDGSSITWPNKATVTVGKPVDECGGGDLPAKARSWDVVS
jgi:hypothetical protein